VLAAGYRTADLAPSGDLAIGTEEFGDRVAEAIRRHEPSSSTTVPLEIVL